MMMRTSTAFEDPRCAQCNAPVQSVTLGDDGKSRWYPCGHDAGLVARIVNPVTPAK
jgi:hypothetical protein